MTYIFKNIKTTIIKNPMLSFLLVLCMVTATLVMLYSYGAFQNYTVQKHTEELKASPDDSFIIEFEGGTTMGELRQALSMLSSDTCESLVGFDEYFYSDLSRLDICPKRLNEYRKKYIESLSDEEDFDVNKVTDEDVKRAYRFLMGIRIEWHSDDNEFGLYNRFLQNTGVSSGRYISDDEERNGSPVIVLYGVDNEIVGKRVTVFGREYEVIGVHNAEDPPTAEMPFNAYPDDVIIEQLSRIENETVIKTPAYEELCEVFEAIYGDRVRIPVVETADVTEIRFYNSMIIISVICAVISAINIAILFKYIMSSRSKTLSVMRINGCSALKARQIYLYEIMLISVFFFILCATLYHRLLLDPLSNYYEHIEGIYTASVYLKMFAVYIASIYVFVNAAIFIHLKKTPLEMFRERGR